MCHFSGSAMTSSKSFIPGAEVSSVCAHRKIISKSYKIKPKSECIYHFPIDLEQQNGKNNLISVWFSKISKKNFCVHVARTTNGCVRLVPNQSENGKYTLISVWFNMISKRFFSVWLQIVGMNCPTFQKRLKDDKKKG